MTQFLVLVVSQVGVTKAMTDAIYKTGTYLGHIVMILMDPARPRPLIQKVVLEAVVEIARVTGVVVVVIQEVPLLVFLMGEEEEEQ